MVDNKVAIVTGGARGIGATICEKFAENGIAIALLDLEKAKDKVKTLKNPKIHSSFNIDVTDFKKTQEVVKEIFDNYGKIDYLINNAGITRDGLLLRMREEDWDAVIDVNLKGTFNMTKHTIPYMVKKRSGKIINISSIVGVMGNPGQSNYSASKSGIIGFTKSIAKEYGSKGIRANAIAPGFVETPMTKKLPERVQKQYLSAIPLKKFAKPEDIASVVNFLVSEAADYITGEVINVSGGLYM